MAQSFIKGGRSFWLSGTSGALAPPALWFLWHSGTLAPLAPLPLWLLWHSGSSATLALWISGPMPAMPDLPDDEAPGRFPPRKTQIIRGRYITI